MRGEEAEWRCVRGKRRERGWIASERTCEEAEWRCV